MSVTSTPAATPASEPTPPAEPPRAPIVQQAPRKRYQLEKGDTPGSVSVKFFGFGNRAAQIAQANSDIAWVSGATIVIPE